MKCSRKLNVRREEELLFALLLKQGAENVLRVC